MLRNLVNHNGTVQYKWFLYNQDDVLDYIEQIGSKNISKRVSNWILNPDSDIQLTQLHTAFKCDVLNLLNRLLYELANSMSKHVKEDAPLVVNETGGYSPYDENYMKILDWEFLYDLKDTVVLENSKSISADLKEYLTKNYPDYLLLSEVYKLSKEELMYYCSKANTIVFQTTAVDREQINNYLTLALSLEPKTIVVFDSPYFPSNDVRLKKHNIIKV